MKIVIADDHAMTRSGVIAALAEMFPVANVIECGDAAEVLKTAKKSNIDLAIVDLFMPGSDGFSFLKKLCKNYPALPVVVLSASDNPKHIHRAVDIGVSGFIHKSSSYELMREAINTILAGGVYMSELGLSDHSLATRSHLDIESPQNREALINNLTKRQLDILTCLTQGMSNKAIAASLFISENTVKTHLKAVMVELDCQNRTEAVILAEKLGLVAP